MTNLKCDIPDFQAIMLPMLRLLGDGYQKSLNETTQKLNNYF